MQDSGTVCCALVVDPTEDVVDTILTSAEHKRQASHATHNFWSNMSDIVFFSQSSHPLDFVGYLSDANHANHIIVRLSKYERDATASTRRGARFC